MLRMIIVFLLFGSLFISSGCQTVQAPSAAAATTTTTTSTTTTTTTATTTTATTTVPGLTFDVQQDTMAGEVFGDNTFGNWNVLFAEWSPTFLSNYVYLQFDISSISPSATITSAILKFYVSAIPSAEVTLDFYNLSASWDEATLTWNNKPATSGSSIASKAFTTSDSGWASIDITNCVQQWVNSSVDNNGLMFASPISLEAKVELYSKEITNTSKPKLEIVVD